MVLLTVATGFLSAWLDNVTTVLLIAPVTILVCRRLGLPVIPYLIARLLGQRRRHRHRRAGRAPHLVLAVQPLRTDRHRRHRHHRGRACVAALLRPGVIVMARPHKETRWTPPLTATPARRPVLAGGGRGRIP
ncbi:SLC13 family permease [Streptomyces jeddahensis]|uniref:SLC13 family permease n=1 Tax=Streptomyces jeddahensis TaxID=1716141 RepID=UPI001E3C2D07|nr:SLC13 family permease [Streptomyces jeddahensis]